MHSTKLQKNLRSLLSFLLLLITFANVTAQDKNPFKSIGKEGKTITLSNGKYEELFDQDSIQQIGTALVNIRQMKVVKLLKEEKEAQRMMDNSTTSRFLSVDPLAHSFAYYTPYQYAGNKPIAYTDLDGLEEIHYVFTWTQDNAVIKLTTWQEGKQIGANPDGTLKFDRPYKIHAHYPVFYKDEVYFVTAAYDSEEAFRKAKASDFTASVINLGTLLGYQAADDLVDKVLMALAVGGLKDALKKSLKTSIEALNTLSIKGAKELAEQSGKSMMRAEANSVASQATEALIDNNTLIKNMGLKDKMTMGWKEGLEKAEQFLD